jgi:uncharacterized cysteine cluster protein YcgN (CxxCxxCC family)
MVVVQCHFDYSCSSLYAEVSQTLKNKLQIARNKTVRFIKNWGPRSCGYNSVSKERNILFIYYLVEI